MQVETFEVLEVDHEGTPECDAAAVELIESLGLTGQQKFVRRKEGATGTVVERSPYRKMTKEEHFVYSRLCPTVKKLDEYDDGPIPLRVLQVAAHAKDIFDKIEVWSAENADVKDPVLVGINGVNSWDTNYSRFLLARWGEVLEPFAVCMRQAAERFRDEYKAAGAKVIAEIKIGMEAIDDTPDSACVGKSVPHGYAH